MPNGELSVSMSLITKNFLPEPVGSNKMKNPILQTTSPHGKQLGFLPVSSGAL